MELMAIELAKAIKLRHLYGLEDSRMCLGGCRGYAISIWERSNSTGVRGLIFTVFGLMRLCTDECP
jgi:hypothetical protein